MIQARKGRHLPLQFKMVSHFGGGRKAYSKLLFLGLVELESADVQRKAGRDGAGTGTTRRQGATPVGSTTLETCREGSSKKRIGQKERKE